MSKAGSLASEVQENEEWDDDPREPVVSIVVPILLAIICIIGLVGNSLVVIVFKRYAQLCSTTNLFIVNLAVADLLFSIICVPIIALDIYVFTYWPFGEIWCKAVRCLIVGCIYASIYTLLFMSLDRYLAVVHPIRSLSLRTVQNAKRATIVLWAIVILLCVPTGITHTVSYSNGDNYPSVCGFQLDEYNLAMYQVTFFLLSFIIPMFIIGILYILMILRVWFRVLPGSNMCSESAHSKEEEKVTRMVVIVVIIFALCWAPIQIVFVFKSFNLYPITHATIIFEIAALMNSCVNPILYAFLSEDFRKAYHRVITCNRHSKRIPDPTADNCRVEQQELTNVNVNMSLTILVTASHSNSIVKHTSLAPSCPSLDETGA